jgi:AcrR family transcriptional regulator
MKQPSTSRRRPSARPGEILEAALGVFAEKGFAAARLDDVAARAGLSKAAIYLYFADKNALLDAVIQDAAGTTLEAVADLIATDQSKVAPLLAQLLLMGARTLTQTRLPQIIKLVISESRAHPEIGQRYLATVIGKILPAAKTLIERGMASGEFRQVDAELAVKSIVAPMVLAAVWRSVFEPLGAAHLDVEQLARQHADLIIRGLTAREERDKS